MKVAVLATDGVEQVELDRPWQVLEEAGAEPELVSLEAGTITAYDHIDKGDTKKVDARGELGGPGRLRGAGAARRRHQRRLRAGRRGRRGVREGVLRRGQAGGGDLPRAWVLVEADVVKGRRMTSWPSLQTDLRNAGADWVDEEVVVDGNLITSRNPDDLDAFGAAIVEEFARGEDDEDGRGLTGGRSPAVRSRRRAARRRARS